MYIYLRLLYLLFLFGGAGEDVALSVELSIVSNALRALLLLSFSSGADLYYTSTVSYTTNYLSPRTFSINKSTSRSEVINVWCVKIKLST